MNNKEIEILKDKYALGTLSEVEHASLEVELLQNPDLEQELKIHTNLVRGVEYAGEIEMKEILEKIHYQQTVASTSLQSEKNNKKNRSVLFIVLGLLIIAAILSYFFLLNTSKETISPTKIYAEFYSPYQPSLQDRGTNLDEAITIFSTSYNEQDYEKALTTIKPYLKESKNDIKLTAAIAAAETNELILAESLLDQVINSNDFYFTDHAIWYKALIQLKKKNTNNVEKILTPLIANPKADHHNEAKELIAKIRG